MWNWSLLLNDQSIYSIHNLPFISICQDPRDVSNFWSKPLTTSPHRDTWSVTIDVVAKKLSMVFSHADTQETITKNIYISNQVQKGNPSYCVSMFIRQACFVRVDPPLVRNLHSRTGCSNGNITWTWTHNSLDYPVVKAPTRSNAK